MLTNTDENNKQHTYQTRSRKRPLPKELTLFTPLRNSSKRIPSSIAMSNLAEMENQQLGFDPAITVPNLDFGVTKAPTASSTTPSNTYLELIQSLQQQNAALTTLVKDLQQQLKDQEKKFFAALETQLLRHADAADRASAPKAPAQGSAASKHAPKLTVATPTPRPTKANKKPANASKAPPTTTNTTTTKAAPTTTPWATVAAKKLPNKGNKTNNTVPSRRRLPTKIQVVRTLQDAAASPSGYDFVYLPCRHHLKFQDVRKMLSTLKVQQSRVLDIQFPAKGTVALLVHSAFKAELLSKLAAEGIKERTDFDPLSPTVLADPKYAKDTPATRTTTVRRLFAERMKRTCLRLPSHIGASVARYFATTTTSPLRLGDDWWQDYIANARPKQQQQQQPPTNTTSATDMFTDVDMDDTNGNSTTNNNQQ